MSKNKLPSLVIVDDEPVIRLLLNEFLQKKFKIHTLNGGLECLHYLEENDLTKILIIDLNMPDISGLEVITILRSNKKWAKLAIIVLSAEESSKDRIRCLNAGADDYMLKPFNPQELDARIYSILRRIEG